MSINREPILSQAVIRSRKSRVKGKWAKEQETAVTKVKKQVVSPVLLVAFDPEKELLLQCDASPYGIGAVLAHNDLQDLECPIAYCSHSSLALAEKR
uniref:Reverse transcriptase/retrotransposon-derived protein RNase H-like domain-containing protein n=1 Tax=Amphimedon queenslandica TaxID=400682 RepID=A0A1X7UXN6_AMPQE